MTTRGCKSRLIVLLVSVLALLGVSLVASPSAYATSCCSINGAGSYTDDWGDNHTICQGCTVPKGNVVGVWQGVLWVDGFSGGAGRIFTNCDVDGGFGPVTASATADWQAGIGGLTVDGKVGAGTWGKADTYLGASSSYVLYYGYNNRLYFHRGATNGDGNYTWSWAGAPYQYTGYYDVNILHVTTNCYGY